MRIWSDEQINGYPIQQIKKLLEFGKHQPHSVLSVSTLFQIRQDEAKKLLIELIEQGFLQRNPIMNDSWMNAVKGDIFAATVIHRLLSVRKLSKNKLIILRRIEELKACDIFAYWVSTHQFYEEAHKDSTSFRELHVYLKFEQVHSNKNLHEEHEDRRRQAAKKQFNNIVEYLYYPINEVIEYVRRGLHNVAVHRAEPDLEFGEIVTVF